MPTVESVAARIEREGQIVTFKRGDASADVPAFVRGYRPDEVVNDIQQGDRELRVAPVTLAALGYPGAPERPDQVIIGDAYGTVQSCETRTFRGVPAMHVIQIRGA